VANGQTAYYSFPVAEIVKSSSPKVVYVTGRASDDTLDRDGQRIDVAWARKALAEWLLEGGSLRQQHDPTKPIGRGISIDPSDGLTVRSAVIDKQARRLVDARVLRAYSVGVTNPLIVKDASAPNGVIRGRPDGSSKIIELSLCDSPSNPSCGVTICRSLPGSGAVYVGKSWGVPDLTKKKHKEAPLIMCTRCGTELDAGEKYCTGCGKRNPHFNVLADKKIPMNQKGATVKGKKRKKALRALKAYQRTDMLTKAAGAPPSFPIYSEAEALRFVLTGLADDCDPGVRFAAAEALGRL
jgi:hypothetical protein